MAAALEPPRETFEKSLTSIDRYSEIEGMILTILRRPALSPLSISELRNELVPIFSEPQILHGVRNLLDDGLIRVVYTSGFEIGFAWA